jgi:hypothetical protein
MRMVKADDSRGTTKDGYIHRFSYRRGGVFGSSVNL